MLSSGFFSLILLGAGAGLLCAIGSARRGSDTIPTKSILFAAALVLEAVALWIAITIVFRAGDVPTAISGLTIAVVGFVLLKAAERLS